MVARFRGYGSPSHILWMVWSSTSLPAKGWINKDNDPLFIIAKDNICDKDSFGHQIYSEKETRGFSSGHLVTYAVINFSLLTSKLPHGWGPTGAKLTFGDVELKFGSTLLSTPSQTTISSFDLTWSMRACLKARASFSESVVGGDNLGSDSYVFQRINLLLDYSETSKHENGIPL